VGARLGVTYRLWKKSEPRDQVCGPSSSTSRRKIPLATLDRQLRAATSEGVQSLGRRSHFSQRTREVGHSGFMDTSEVCGPAGHGYVAGTTVTVRLAWKLVATPLQV
jgi:hypothetical protein